ncbi:hypothetical protein BJ165DRAFT_299165 [Panaeolus papilionaceus]|nr:hypothetical protein BJ165DRAFT_299165 [Panaeolus papilionaceus]
MTAVSMTRRVLTWRPVALYSLFFSLSCTPPFCITLILFRVPHSYPSHTFFPVQPSEPPLSSRSICRNPPVAMCQVSICGAIPSPSLLLFLFYFSFSFCVLKTTVQCGDVTYPTLNPADYHNILSTNAPTKESTYTHPKGPFPSL